ncbi:MAG: hypothetical protein V4604_10715 [Bacteroidota bacterium]
MRKSFQLFVLACFLVNCTGEPSRKAPIPAKQAQQHSERPKEDPEIVYETQDLQSTKKVLSGLFNSAEFDTHGSVIWEANEKKHPEIPVCYDLKCHTEVDTILYFVDSEGQSCAAVVLASYNYEYDDNGKIAVVGAHSEGTSLGLALFAKNAGLWKLYALKKHLTWLGEWGIYKSAEENGGVVSLKKLGQHWTAICFKQGIIGNTGEFWGTDTFFGIERRAPVSQKTSSKTNNKSGYCPFIQLFQYHYHHNYYFPDSENQNSVTTTMKTVETNSGVFDLRLESKTVNTSVYSDKINSSGKTVAHYTWSEKSGQFVVTKKP